jgi:hypothetical protein
MSEQEYRIIYEFDFKTRKIIPKRVPIDRELTENERITTAYEKRKMDLHIEHSRRLMDIEKEKAIAESERVRLEGEATRDFWEQLSNMTDLPLNNALTEEYREYLRKHFASHLMESSNDQA